MLTFWTEIVHHSIFFIAPFEHFLCNTTLRGYVIHYFPRMTVFSFNSS